MNTNRRALLPAAGLAGEAILPASPALLKG